MWGKMVIYGMNELFSMSSIEELLRESESRCIQDGSALWLKIAKISSVRCLCLDKLKQSLDYIKRFSAVIIICITNEKTE